MADKHFEANVDSEIREFGTIVHRALDEAGGFELVERAEADPQIQLGVIEPILRQLGILDLAPHQGDDQLQAAAVACRAAGAFVLPYPLAERIAGTSPAIPTGTTSDGRPRALAVVADGSRSAGPTRINMGGLAFDWWVVEAPTGSIARASSVATAGAGRLGPFVADVETRAPDSHDVAPDISALALSLNLQSFTLLGVLDSALQLTTRHTNDRVQFGAPIVKYQAVQHQLADALIALQSFEAQAHYALWSIATERPSLLVDVVGARLAGLQAADIVIRAGHQLHGATGFCDETPMSWLSRHSQPLRRLPLDRSRTEQWFVDLVLENGFDGIFPTQFPDHGTVTSKTASARAARLVTPISEAHA
ncbi:acyl-CoA dehydrogenase family protein [Rhodococcoides yunnanense]|uniref:acyl-CoA dehydrogenase family protein n=1 Tax=Rhodococcoides yunnanense TaxID=278209 RepID=UPI0009352D38|nr:acyl-CoA dehydrogenase family protein [Rhodococcus yunnanensis]